MLLIYALNYLKRLYLDLLVCVASVSVLFSVRGPDEEFSAFWLGEGTETACYTGYEFVGFCD